MFSDLMKNAVSGLKSRGALCYVHQNQNNGIFTASDGRILLQEDTNTPPLFEFWDPITQAPVNNPDLKYPDIKVAFDRVPSDRQLKPLKAPTIKNGLAKFGNCFVRAKQWEIVKEFLGRGALFYNPDTVGNALYFESADGQKKALLLSYKIESFNELHEWKIKDASGTIIYTTKNVEEAEMFGLNIIFEGD